MLNNSYRGWAYYTFDTAEERYLRKTQAKGETFIYNLGYKGYFEKLFGLPSDEVPTLLGCRQ